MVVNGKVKCIKTVVMDLTGEITFTEGQIYSAHIGTYIDAINNQDEKHGLGTRYCDEFVKEHFEIIEED